MINRATVYGFLAATAILVAGFSFASNQQQERKGQVLLFLSTDCPVAALYTPRINELYGSYAPAGFEFKAYFPNDLESREGLEQYMKQRSYGFPAELDLAGEKAKSLGVTAVPTVVILDEKGKKLYMGAIDDHKDSTLVKQKWAEQVLADVSAGKTPAYKETKPFGCLLMPGDAIPTAEAVNYAEHVAPILNKHCVECHRPGEVAPFSLVGYENAKKWSPMINFVTENKTMPPWKAVHGFGEFLDENRLSEKQIETLKRWHEAGGPRGEASKEPAVPKFAGEWSLGQPDLVLQPSRPFKLNGEGADVYRNFVIKTDFKETKWVTAIDVKPGNKKVVHHVIAFLDENGRSQALQERSKDGQEGYSTFGGIGFLPSGSLGGWAPGLRARHVKENVAFELKPGTTIVMQVHYHKNGVEEEDQTRLGLYFAKQPPKQAMQLAWIANPMIRIPANQANHREQLTFNVPADVTLHGVLPHMHLLGKSMKAEAVKPDGTKIPLIYIDKWDFNWQMQYVFREPVKLPRGSKIHVEAFYDNSSDNPNNPNDPPKPVRWGEETTDEMFLLVAGYTIDNQKIGDGSTERLRDLFSGGRQ